MGFCVRHSSQLDLVIFMNEYRAESRMELTQPSRSWWATAVGTASTLSIHYSEAMVRPEGCCLWESFSNNSTSCALESWTAPRRPSSGTSARFRWPVSSLYKCVLLRPGLACSYFVTAAAAIPPSSHVLDFVVESTSGLTPVSLSILSAPFPQACS